MIEDNFEKWYWEVWEPSDLYRIARDDLRAAYKAGWERSREVDEVLTELVQIAQEMVSMTEEQHKRVNELALEVYQIFLEKYPEDMVHEEEEVGLVGTAYGYMLILATLGYKPVEMGQDAVEGVKKIMELVEND